MCAYACIICNMYADIANNLVEMQLVDVGAASLEFCNRKWHQSVQAYPNHLQKVGMYPLYSQVAYYYKKF